MYSIFESEIIIRPDDIDLNNHVHHTKYLDYVLAARYHQMKEFYKMSMNDFFDLGYNWYVSITHIEYKRGLKLDDKIAVRTQVDYIDGAQCKVNFWVVKKGADKSEDKAAAEGYIIYTMVAIKSGKPARIPEEIIKVYAI
jgi:YbgC/YbaW family acyl-CoA thioester hydrolase